MSKQVRHWMITLFPKMDIWANEEVLLKALEGMLKTLPKMGYSIFQLESCPKTEKIHVQLYIEYSQSKRFKTVVKHFTFEGFSNPHVESRRKSRTACRDYCKNDSKRLEGTNFIEIGNWRLDSKTKKSNGFKTCAELVQQGYDEIWIAYNRPELFLRYGNRIKDLIHHRKLYEIRENKRKRFLSETENNQEEE